MAFRNSNHQWNKVILRLCSSLWFWFLDGYLPHHLVKKELQIIQGRPWILLADLLSGPSPPKKRGPRGTPDPQLHISVIVRMEEVLPLEKLSVQLHLPAKTPFSPLLHISENLMTDWWPALYQQMWCCFEQGQSVQQKVVEKHQLKYLTWQCVPSLVHQSDEKLIHCTSTVEKNGIITIANVCNFFFFL